MEQRVTSSSHVVLPVQNHTQLKQTVIQTNTQAAGSNPLLLFFFLRFLLILLFFLHLIFLFHIFKFFSLFSSSSSPFILLYLLYILYSLISCPPPSLYSPLLSYSHFCPYSYFPSYSPLPSYSASPSYCFLIFILIFLLILSSSIFPIP